MKLSKLEHLASKLLCGLSMEILILNQESRILFLRKAVQQNTHKYNQQGFPCWLSSAYLFVTLCKYKVIRLDEVNPQDHGKKVQMVLGNQWASTDTFQAAI